MQTETKNVQVAQNLLSIPFTTVFEYLFLLRELAAALASAGSSALMFLAAAVSDFYIPEAEMVSEKIQSSSDGVRLQLRGVPKMLGLLKELAPQAFVVSFKLETNPNILLAKAGILEHTIIHKRERVRTTHTSVYVCERICLCLCAC